MFVSETNKILSSWIFYNNNGFESSRLQLGDNGGEVTTIYPFQMTIWNGGDKVIRLEPAGITVEDGVNQTTINADQISMNSGSEWYRGYTGTAEYVPPNGYSKTLYFKNGILYKIG